MSARVTLARRALTAITDQHARDEITTRERDREQRRHEREHTGGAGTSAQCGGCSRFLRSLREDCACGFSNDIRGHRNHGRYA